MHPGPSVSVIIPVINEAIRINHTLACLPPLLPGTEIIVVDGDASGTTINAVSRDDIIRIVSPRKGRGPQLNAGAAAGRGHILLFLHADTRLPADAFLLIEAALSETPIAAGAFSLKIESIKPAFRIIEKMASLRSRITRIPYGDQAIFIKSACFKKIGGFADIPIMEDVDLMRRLRRAGARVRILPAGAVTSARRWEKEGVVTCTLRNWMLALLFSTGFSPEKLSRYYPL